MDQVRNILRIIWQQRFWVLSVLGVIIAAVCWKMGASALDAQFTANKAQIDGKFGDMQKIQSASVLGNQSVNEKEFSEASKIRDKVLTLWKTMYDSQRTEALTWPKGLGEEFLAYVENKKFRDPINDLNMRQTYRQYAKAAFPDLVDIVKARKMAVDGAGGGYGGEAGRGGFGPMGDTTGMVDAAGNPIPPEKYLVQWYDQGAVREELEFASLPTSLKIWVTQEDLWVYETLLGAIAEVNDERGATRPDNTAISEIRALEVGRLAGLAFKERGIIMMPAATGGEGGAEMGREGATSGEGMTGREGYGPEGGGDPDAGLLASRYIGDDGQPAADEASAVNPSAQFRRLPVRMLLQMEQEAIPNIIVACANATLPIEVKRVRINSEKSETGANMTSAITASAGGGREGGGGYGGRGGGYGMESGRTMGRPSGGGYGMESGRGGTGGYSSMQPSADTMMRTDLVTVEIHGIVYIYNPPDATTLTVPGGPETVAATNDGSAAIAR